MRVLKFTLPLFFVVLSLGCVQPKKVSESKIPVKRIEAGVCVFGAKTTQKAVITTRSDCVLRGGAFSLDNAQDSQDSKEAKAEVL